MHLEDLEGWGHTWRIWGAWEGLGSHLEDLGSPLWDLGPQGDVFGLHLEGLGSQL